jgi:putative transposase
VAVNHKRVERLYSEAELQVRRRKKVPLGKRQPLVRPEHADQVWSMDFVFDRSADGRVINCLTIVDDATHESVAIVPERAIDGTMLTRILDRLQITRELPKVIRTDNGKHFYGRAPPVYPTDRQMCDVFRKGLIYVYFLYFIESVFENSVNPAEPFDKQRSRNPR